MPSNRLRPATFAAVLAIFALGAAGAHAAETIGVQPGAFEFSQAEFASDEGGIPVFAGDGINMHNVTAKDRGPDGGRLFRSRTIRTGTTPVDGAQYLTAGRYAFECTIHAGMEATLVVGSEGDPKTRPRVVLTVLRQTLGQVGRTGRLRIRLRSPTGAKDVVVVAKGAGVRLASEGGLDVAKGGSRVVRLRLTNRGRSALAGRRSARVTLRGSVAFGPAAMASRTLRTG